MVSHLLLVVALAGVRVLSASASLHIPDYYAIRPTSSHHWPLTLQPRGTGPTATSPPRCSASTGTMPLGTAFPTALASKRYHLVDVGASGGNVFQPNLLNASVGDVVQFNFLAVNHSVTQSELLTPCIGNGGFDTGFNQFNRVNTSGQFVVHFEVHTASPRWFFCAQVTPVAHCRAGMLFGLNPAGHMSQFLRNAHNTTTTGSSSNIGSVGHHHATSCTPNTTSSQTTTSVTISLATGSAFGNTTPSAFLNQTSVNVGQPTWSRHPATWLSLFLGVIWWNQGL